MYAIVCNHITLDRVIVYTDIRQAIQVLAYLITYARLTSESEYSLSQEEITNEFMIACKIAYKRFEAEISQTEKSLNLSAELYDYYLTLGSLTYECADPRKIPKSYPLTQNIHDYDNASIVSIEISDDTVKALKSKNVYEIDYAYLVQNADFELDAFMSLVDNFNKTRTESFSPYIKVSR